MKNATQTINCEIARDAHRAARHRSLDTGETLGEIITEALRALLAPPRSDLREPVTPAREKGKEP